MVTTTSDVAAALGLSPATVRSLAARGRIPSHPTPGGHRRYDLDQVRAALAAPTGPPSLAALRARRGEIAALARRHGARHLRVVGSLARDEQQPGSDVDLLVDLDPGRTLFDVAALHDDLTAALGVHVDIITSGAARGRLAHLLDDAVEL